MSKKRILSFILSTLLIIASVDPLIGFAEGEYSSSPIYFWSGTTSMIEGSEFGLDNQYRSYVNFSKQTTISCSEGLTNLKSITFNPGDVLRLSFSVAASSDVGFSTSPQVGFYVSGTGSKASDNSFDWQSGLYINLSTGGFQKDNSNGGLFTLPSPQENVTPCVLDKWNTYDFVITVGKYVEGASDNRNNTMSIYKDGVLQLTIDDYLASKGHISNLSNLVFWKRGSDAKPFYLTGIRWHHYPSAIVSSSTLVNEPITLNTEAAKSFREVNGEFVLTNLSLTPSELEAMYTTGGATAAFVPKDGILGDTVEDGYLRINYPDNTRYFKNIKISDGIIQTLVNNRTYALPEAGYEDSKNWADKGMIRPQLMDASELQRIPSLAGKSATNYAMGFVCTNKTVTSSGGYGGRFLKSGWNETYPAWTGNVLYEFSFMHSGINNPITMTLNYNNTNAYFTFPFIVNTDGTVASPKGSSNTFNMPADKWHRMSVLVSTDTDTVKLYVNGNLVSNYTASYDIQSLGFMDLVFDRYGKNESFNINGSFYVDDYSVKQVENFYEPSDEYTLTATAEKIDQEAGIIIYNGSVPSDLAASKGTISYYTDNSYTTPGTAGTDKYILLKSDDEKIIKYYALTDTEFKLANFELDTNSKTASAYIENFKSKPQNVTIIIASYADGSLVDISFKEMTYGVKQTGTIDIELEETSSATSYKAFIIDRFSKLTPLATSK